MLFSVVIERGKRVVRKEGYTVLVSGVSEEMYHWKGKCARGDRKGIHKLTMKESPTTT